TGPRIRLEMRFHDLPYLAKGSRLMIGAEVTHDNVRNTQAFGLIQLRIPFGAVTKTNTPQLTALERRMVDPVVRDVDVVTAAQVTNTTQVLSETTVDALNPHTGNAINTVATVNAGNSGTVHTEVANAGADSLVILDGSGGTINNATSVTLQNGQILASAGKPLMLQYNDPK